MALSEADYTKLLESFRKGNENLATAMQRYRAAEESDELLTSIQEEIVEICDVILAAGDWQSSAFLRQVIAPVEETKATMLKGLGRDGSSSTEIEFVQDTDMQEVFIAVYQSDGHNMAAWNLMMRSLPEFMLGRPSYAKEEEAVAFVRSKADRSTEAYVKAYIPKKSIMDDAGLVRRDRIGQPLLQISQGALLVKNIRSFHHMGETYLFNGKDLVRK